MLTGKRVLVTGGTGSLGSTLVRRLLRGELGRPEAIVVFSRDEAKQHAMRLALAPARRATDEVIYRDWQRIAALPHRRRRATTRRSARPLRGTRRRLQRGRAQAGAHLRVLPGRRRSGPTSSGPEHIVRAIREQRLPVETVVGDLHRQGLQAGQRHGHDQGDPGARSSSRPTSIAPGHALRRAPATATCSPRAARSSRCSTSRSAQGGPVTLTTPEMTRFLLSSTRRSTRSSRRCRTRGPARSTSRACPRARMTDVAAALIGDRPIETRRHRHPARREGARDPGLRGGGAPHRRRAATTSSIQPDAAGAGWRAGADGAAARSRAYTSARRPARPRRESRAMLRAERLAASTDDARRAGVCPHEGRHRPRHPPGDHPAQPRHPERSTPRATTSSCTPARTTTSA